MGCCLRLYGRRAAVCLSLILVLVTVLDPELVSAYSLDEARMSVQLADDAVSSAFGVVLEAETAGANVSELTLRLNGALDLLVEAMRSLENGGFDDAVELAGRSVDIAESVEVDASASRLSALSHRDFLFKVYLTGSIIGVPVFLVFMLLFWRRFKGYYARRVLGLKPEVGQDAEA